MFILQFHHCLYLFVMVMDLTNVSPLFVFLPHITCNLLNRIKNLNAHFPHRISTFSPSPLSHLVLLTLFSHPNHPCPQLLNHDTVTILLDSSHHGLEDLETFAFATQMYILMTIPKSEMSDCYCLLFHPHPKCALSFVYFICISFTFASNQHILFLIFGKYSSCTFFIFVLPFLFSSYLFFSILQHLVNSFNSSLNAGFNSLSSFSTLSCIFCRNKQQGLLHTILSLLSSSPK